MAIALQNLGKPKEAEDAFKQGLHWARTKGGKLARFHTSLGLFYLSQNRWMEAIKSFAGPKPERAIVEPGARAILSEFDDFATHYEVLLEAADRQ